MLKRYSALLLVLVILAAIFSSCMAGGEQSAASSVPSESAVPASSSSQTPESAETTSEITGNLRVLYPGMSDFEKEMAYFIEGEIAKRNPGIKIEWLMQGWSDIRASLATMTAAGDYPDLAMTLSIPTEVAMGILEPIDGYFDDDLAKDVFNKKTLDFFSQDGNVYALPLLSCVDSNIVDSEALAAINKTASDLKTWEDMLAIAKEYKEKTGKAFFAGGCGGQGNDLWYFFYHIGMSNGVWIADVSDAKKQNYIEALQFVIDLKPYTSDSVLTWQIGDILKAFEYGDVAFANAGSWFSPNIISFGERTIGTAVPLDFPKGPSNQAGQTAITTSGLGIEMLAGSSQKEASWEAMKSFVSAKSTGVYSGGMHVSARLDVQEADIMEGAKMAYGDSYAGPMAITNEYAKLADIGMPAQVPFNMSQVALVLQKAFSNIYNSDSPSAEAIYEEIRAGIEDVNAQYK